MQKLISQARERRDIGSNDALARAVIDAHPAPTGVKPRSLSAKIGQLDKGETGWWKSRPEWSEALASVLGVDIADLGLHTAIESQSFLITEFPEFPPIDLASGDLPMFGKEIRIAENLSEFSSKEIKGWFPKDHLRTHPLRERPSGINWLEISDAFCAQLISGVLQTKCKWDVINSDDLSSLATRLRRPAPIVVNLVRRIEASELLPLRALHDEGAVLILSRYPPPLREKSKLGDEMDCWEAMQGTTEERALLALTSKTSFWLNIEHYVWQLDDDWRKSLLNWIEDQCHDSGTHTLLDAKSVLKWLDEFDRHKILFTCHSDIFRLAQFCHHHGEKTLPKLHGAGATNKLQAWLRPALNSRDAALFKNIIKARWAALEVDLTGALSWDQWRQVAITSKSLSKLSDYDLNLAVDQGLLREDANGLFDFAHSFEARLHIRELVTSAIAEGNIDFWGAAVFDEARRKFVDSIIEILPTAVLVKTVDLLSSTSPWSPASIGSEESLFLGLAGRVWADEIKQHTVDRIFDAMSARGFPNDESSVPRLWSRPYSTGISEWKWMQTCWQWSMGTKQPQSVTLHDYSIPYFPGWISKTTWPRFIPPQGDSDSEYISSSDWSNFVRLAVDLTDKLIPSEFLNCEKNSNESLFALILAFDGKWQPEANWWTPLLSLNDWAEERIINHFQLRGKEAAAWLWPSFTAALTTPSDSNYLARWDLISRSKVWQWMMSTLTPTDVFEGRTEQEIRHLCAWARHLPPKFRVHLLDTLPTDGKYSISQLIEWCPEQNCDSLTRWLNAANYLGWEEANGMWAASPQYVLSVLRSENILTEYAVEILITQTPVLYVSEVASILGERLVLLDAMTRKEWVKQHLGTSGRNASKILSVLQEQIP